MEDGICVWDGVTGRVLSEGVLFTTGVKPDVGFDYETLYYETPFHRAVVFDAHGERPLTEEEISGIRVYCEGFAAANDYLVQAYEEDTGVYAGEMLKSEASAKGYGYRYAEVPEHAAMKWTGAAWETIHAVIMEDGNLALRPSGICNRCVKFFTFEEFEKFPARPSPVHVYDFALEAWVDKRDLEQLKKDVSWQIRNTFEAIRWGEAGTFVPQYEQDTWAVQIAEAENWLKDAARPTPYIDTFLARRTDGAVPTKEELCKDILANHAAYVTAVAGVNAVQWKFLKDIQACADNAAVDALLESLKKFQTAYVSGISLEEAAACLSTSK